jgi:hypothetical protein
VADKPNEQGEGGREKGRMVGNKKEDMEKG